MDGVEQFIEELLSERGLSSLDPEIKKDIKSQMMQELMDQIDRAAINALPEERAIELAKKLDDAEFGSDQAAAFMKESGVDLQQIALNTMMTYRKLYLENVYENDESRESNTPVEVNGEKKNDKQR